MIDIILYRFRIGIFHGNTSPTSGKKTSCSDGGVRRTSRFNYTGNSIDDQCNLDTHGYFNFFNYRNLIFYLLFYVLFMIYIFTLTSLITIASSLVSPQYGYSLLSTSGPSLALEYKSLFLVYFFIHLFNQFRVRELGSCSGFYCYIKTCMAKNIYLKVVGLVNVCLL